MILYSIFLPLALQKCLPKVKNLLMECSLLFYFVGFDFTVIMLLYVSGYALCLKRTKSSCKVWKDKMLPFMAAETWNQWQERKYFYCALMNLGFVFYGCLYLWKFVMYFEGDYWKACALWGLKWCTVLTFHSTSN